VGGPKAADAETAMPTAGRLLARHLHAVTDGKTGDRRQWIFWQIEKRTAVDGIALTGTGENPDAQNDDYREFPELTIDPSLTDLPPAGVKFQVSISTPYATVVAWVAVDAQEAFFP
jgi:hypothetical protein